MFSASPASDASLCRYCVSMPVRHIVSIIGSSEILISEWGGEGHFLHHFGL
jgi:hypothetical protein